MNQHPVPGTERHHRGYSGLKVDVFSSAAVAFYRDLRGTGDQIDNLVAVKVTFALVSRTLVHDGLA